MLSSILGNKKKIEKKMIDPHNMPKHVAIIMDGNGRWAKSYGMPRSMGHRRGADTLKNIVKNASDMGIKALTVYGFSTENWKRPEEEVSLLMGLIKEYLLSNVKDMHKNNVCIRFIGYIKALSSELQEIIKESEELTKNNDGLILNLAINYGGRDELVMACKEIASKVVKGELSIDSVDEDLISKNLYTKDYIDVDLLIRPSGDYRISNFLLWQLAYAEFYFTDKNWPEFSKEDLEDAVLVFQNRERRFGGLKGEE